MLPQVDVLLFGGPLSNLLIDRVGLDRAAWLSAVSVVLGLAVYGLFSSFGYIWIAIALVLVAAGIRVNGVVAGTNVLRGLPTSRTSIFAALFDTASEVATAVGITVGGVMLGGNSRDSVDSAVRSLISSIISGFCEEQLATKGQVVGSYSTRWEPGRA